jgi:TetR/AcrR family fatty acid metabolism transcriptional regulator
MQAALQRSYSGGLRPAGTTYVRIRSLLRVQGGSPTLNLFSGDSLMKEDRPKTGNKKDIIIAAAVQVFSKKGYHDTRMEEIALAAGIGKGTIYEYFESKLRLFQEMLGNSLQVYYSNLRSNDLDKLTFRERIKFMLEGHFAFCLKNRELTQILFRDDVCDEELKEWSFKLHKEKEKHLQEMITEAIDRGELRNVDTKLASMMVIGVLHSIWMPLIVENWQAEPEYVSNQLTDLIMHGLAR